MNKVNVQFPYILVWKLHTQACEIVAGTKRKPCKKFQVDICKTKKDRSAHVQLRQAMICSTARVRKLSTKLQVDSDTCKTKRDRSAYAQFLILISCVSFFFFIISFKKFNILPIIIPTHCTTPLYGYSYYYYRFSHTYNAQYIYRPLSGVQTIPVEERDNQGDNITMYL